MLANAWLRTQGENQRLVAASDLDLSLTAEPTSTVEDSNAWALPHRALA